MNSRSRARFSDAAGHSEASESSLRHMQLYDSALKSTFLGLKVSLLEQKDEAITDGEKWALTTPLHSVRSGECLQEKQSQMLQ